MNNHGYKFMKPSISDRQKAAMGNHIVKLEERVERLENVLLDTIKNLMDVDSDNTWHSSFDSLHEFIKEIKKEREEK